MAGKVDAKKVKKRAPAPAAAAKKAKTKTAHPPTAEMVTTAITVLKESDGSSLAAIKKYLAANYSVDVDRLAPYIKKFLKSAVLSGNLIQTRGKGAGGSFKLPNPTPKKVEKEQEKRAAPKKKVTTKPEKKKRVYKWRQKKSLTRLRIQMKLEGLESSL